VTGEKEKRTGLGIGEKKGEWVGVGRRYPRGGGGKRVNHGGSQPEDEEREGKQKSSRTWLKQPNPNGRGGAEGGCGSNSNHVMGGENAIKRKKKVGGQERRSWAAGQSVLKPKGTSDGWIGTWVKIHEFELEGGKRRGGFSQLWKTRKKSGGDKYCCWTITSTSLGAHKKGRNR